MVAFFTLLTPAVSDASVVTTSSAAVGTPATNLLLDQPRAVWKSTSNSSEFIQVNLGSAKAIDQVFLGFTNLSATATARIRIAATQANLIAAPTFDSGTIQALTESNPADFPLDRGHLFQQIVPTQTQKWVRIDLDDPSNGDAFVSAGRLIIGEAWTPSDNVKLQMGYSVGVLDASPRQVRRDRGIVVDPRPKPSRFRGTLISRGGLNTDVEPEILDNLDEVLRKRGGSAPVLLVLEPGSAARRHKKIFYGIPASQLLQATLATSNIKRYKLALTVDEMI